jgi:hypothetical protein
VKIFQKQTGCCLVNAEAVADEECMCFSLGSLGFSLGSLKFGLSLTVYRKQANLIQTFLSDS